MPDIMVDMGQDNQSTERNANLWAPWRMAYIDSLNDGGPSDGCFLCRYREDPANDVGHLVLWRGEHCFAVLNRFPYTGGHSMIAPLAHVPALDQLDDATMLEMMKFLRDMQRILGEALRCEGFNIGINVGRCAGAGLPGHLHMHIVPRWGGDTNFMSVFGGVRVIPQTLESLYTLLKETGARLGLPQTK